MLHRWLGLLSATFLTIAGLTGALIAWDHELDAWLNPELFAASRNGRTLTATELATRLEAAEPELVVSFLPLYVEPGHALTVFVMPRAVDAQPLPFNQVFLEPHTGRVLGRRLWGEPSLARAKLVPFLYRLHYSLHLPDVGGIELGLVLMGIVAIVWTLDAFIALYIAFPNRRSWRKSFAFRVATGGRRLMFDLHRSGGVWLWPLLLVFATTAVSMNLGDEVVRPIVSRLSTLTPEPFDQRARGTPNSGAPEAIAREQMIELARAEARRRGIEAPAGGLFYARAFGLYRVSFFEGDDFHGDGGLGNPQVFVDAGTGKLVALTQPGHGSLGDLFMQAQFPIHSGRILGTTGRILVSLLGLSIALLSVTGVWLWAKKRIARARLVPAAT